MPAQAGIQDTPAIAARTMLRNACATLTDGGD